MLVVPADCVALLRTMRVNDRTVIGAESLGHTDMVRMGMRQDNRLDLLRRSPDLA